MTEIVLPPIARVGGARPARLANERQIVCLLRYLHLFGGTLYQEKIPFPGYVMRSANRRQLLTFSSLDGHMRAREGHTQVAMTDAGRAFLKMRDCLRFGQEDEQIAGRNDYDRDFAAVLLNGEAGFNTIPYTEAFE